MKKTKLFLALALSGSLFVLTAAISANNEPTEVAQEEVPVVEQALKFEKTFHDFGTMTRGDKVSEVFTFTNTSDKVVQITSHHVQCGCTTPVYSKEPIQPGETGEISVGFNSTHKSGTQHKTVTLNTTQGTYKLSFKCVVNVPTVE